MEAAEIFYEIAKYMKCDEVVLIGNKESYKEGMLNREVYYLTYYVNGVKCSLTFTKAYE